MGKGENYPNSSIQKGFSLLISLRISPKVLPTWQNKIVRCRLEDFNIFLEMADFSVKYVKVHFF